MSVLPGKKRREIAILKRQVKLLKEENSKLMSKIREQIAVIDELNNTIHELSQS